jgi:hypothetical protein
MKTTIKTLMISAIVGLLTLAGSPAAKAGDQEWATVGKVLTGVMAGSVLANALCPPPPVYVSTPAVAVAPTPVSVVRYVSAPRVVVQQPVRRVIVQSPRTQVVVQPAPVPVVVQPAPVVYPAPVVVRPYPPVIGVGFHFGWHRHHHHHHHW